jgi:putative transposase
MTPVLYPSDLTDPQWGLVERRIPLPKRGGRPRTVDMRQVVNAILYLVRSGCAWRMLPRDFPPWGTVHYYYWKWRRCGVWRKIHDALREEVRIREGRDSSPSAAIMDSQSVKTTEKGGPNGATTRGKR